MIRIKEIVLEETEQFVLKQLYQNPEIYCMKIYGDEFGKNCYILGSEGDMLVIDPPFTSEAGHCCFKRVLSRLNYLGRKIRIFYTHLRCGKFGSVPVYLDKKAVLYINENELLALRDNRVFEERKKEFIGEGYPEDEFLKPSRCSRVYEQKYGFIQEPIEDGEEIQVGKVILYCIHTPGHTKGHTCLWMPKNNILFSGDLMESSKTTVFDLRKGENRVEAVLRSIERVREIPQIETVYGSHSVVAGDVFEVLDQVVNRYYMILLEIYQIVNRHPGLNAYEISVRRNQIKYEVAKWTVHESLSLMNETLAFLIFLRERKYIEVRESEDGRRNYPGEYQLTDAGVPFKTEEDVLICY